MRQVIVQVARGCAEKVVATAHDVEAINIARWRARGGDDDEVDVVLLHVGNAALEPLLDRLSELPGLCASLFPSGVLALHPPSSHAPDQVRDVELRSPIEVLLSGIQSIGTWRGFLTYATASGVVVWIGLNTDTPYLLTAAMLLAPFAGPAMNAAVATARGDGVLLGRSALRYAGALVVAVAVAWALSAAVGEANAPRLALEASQSSSGAVLLPLAAGVAGATHLVQSERSSLVTGAAVGALVAASLAPPAGIVGIALAVGRADLVWSGLFVLGLQFVGIHVAATLVFRLCGLDERGARYDRGRRWIFVVATALAVAALAALLLLQFRESPEYQRTSVAQRAAAEIRERLARDPAVRPVRTEISFTRADLPAEDALLCIVYVQREPGAPPAEQVRAAVTEEVQALLSARGYRTTPLVDVRVLEPPAPRP